MNEKIMAMLGSVSFWFAVIGGVVLVLGQYDIVSVEVAAIIAGWCGFGITKRTYDKTITPVNDR